MTVDGCAYLARFWRSAFLYWGRSGERLAWFLSALNLLVILCNLGTLYGINEWNRGIFDALQKHQIETVFFFSVIYFPLLAVSVAIMVGQIYARMTLQRRWRAWLSGWLMGRWLGSSRHYQLALVAGEHKNPEFRIADDVRVATEAPVEFATGLISALLSAATFMSVLWTLSRPLEFSFANIHVVMPGFLVITAILYAALASGFMAWIGRRFIRVSQAKNQAEAEYRYALTRLRENGESIALLNGENEERVGVEQSLRQVLSNWRELCFQSMKTTLVSQTSGFFAPILPLILCSPQFLDGSLTLGQLMQAASAFTLVQAAFAWLVDNYPKLADWAASARRVASLMISIDALEQTERGHGIGRTVVHRVGGDVRALRLINLTVALSDGTPMLEEVTVAVNSGERLLIVGESGMGKSTLVRAIAGLWRWGDGRIEIAADLKMIFLPQQSYVPLGTLRRAAAYPDASDSHSGEAITEALRSVGLEHLQHRLDEHAPWDQILSAGEKQKLGFARVFLHDPDIVVMDEATSAIDPYSQHMLMDLLVRWPKPMTLVSVGHRPELERYHVRKIVLERRGGSTRLVSDAPLVPQSTDYLVHGKLSARHLKAKMRESTRSMPGHAHIQLC